MTSWQKMTRAMCERHPETAAQVVEEMGPEEGSKLLASLSRTAAAAIVERMSPLDAGALFAQWAEADARAILGQMSAESLGRVWTKMTPEQKEKLSGLVDPDSLKQLQTFGAHRPDSVGAMADPRVLLLRESMTVREAVARIHKAPPERVHYLYVTDSAEKLTGVIQIRDLLLADAKTPLSDIMHRELVTLLATSSREAAIGVARQAKFLALPVVDGEGRFVGVVRTEELLKAAEQEVSEDVQKMFGAGADERVLSPIPFSIRQRLPWLIVNLGTAFLAAAVVGIFEETIALLPMLAVLMPIVAGQGGNTGAQSLAVMIRGLALGEVDSSARPRAVMKECALGLLNGLAIGLITSLGVLLWSGSWWYAGLMGVAMVITMVAAGFAGALIPIAMKSMGRDPAQSSSIILTTVTDVCGFFVFLGLGAIFAASLRA
jgi:magnesium transporter